MIQFANLYFLLLIPLIVFLFLIRKNRSVLKFSSVKLLESAGMRKTVKHKIGKYIILSGLIILVIALARPQLPQKAGPASQKGIDITMALDVSGSMQSVDFEPNRLEVARKTMEDFIKGRNDDRISLVIFAGTAYTRVPLTLDHNILRESLAGVHSKSVNQDGTAIGMAVSVGLSRLKKSDSASRILILVTDGDNNAGDIDPNTASQLAKDLGVRIYTIGVGSDKTIIPVDYFGQTRYQQVEGGLDEELLKNVANTTGGQYYRAKDPQALAQIFSTIDKLEKSKFQQDNFVQYHELAYILIEIGLLLLLAGIFIDKYYFVQIP
ncbi:vWA domain-containing protein [Pseudobacteroides cellulosolvens]|uniref:Double-transmembrane region domain protein n=1 Tax=Pseudobacteroides cellulosolvens ATCC 35603 = DSM 2933 TaxID=398512 RepID=A0A0L6JS92_9FIRM|nr:VWA domain-containing protein [Pseudobacteroides cellulosolvens]KNY28678.1 double-transmembrane region domain protein [Pseudobacteroides cellulosolvens ATCC 35603 = DSM 2933]